MNDFVSVQQVCVEEGELVPVDSLEIFRPLTVCDGLPLEGCVLSIRLEDRVDVVYKMAFG